MNPESVARIVCVRMLLLNLSCNPNRLMHTLCAAMRCYTDDNLMCRVHFSLGQL